MNTPHHILCTRIDEILNRDFGFITSNYLTQQSSYHLEQDILTSCHLTETLISNQKHGTSKVMIRSQSQLLVPEIEFFTQYQYGKCHGIMFSSNLMCKVYYKNGKASYKRRETII